MPHWDVKVFIVVDADCALDADRKVEEALGKVNEFESFGIDGDSDMVDA